MAKNICFVGNFNLTILFEKIADLMIKEGYNVYWMIPAIEQYNYLSNKFGKDKVLNIDLSIIRKSVCNLTGDYKLNEIIYGDRIWKYDMQKGLTYLKALEKPMLDFIKDNKIGVIFSEITWAHEVLLYRICSQHKELNVRVMSPLAVRIPNKKIAFFTDEKKQNVFNRKKSVEKTTIIPLKVERPDYIAIQDKLLKKNSSISAQIKRVKNYLTITDEIKNNPCYIHKRWTRFYLKFIIEYNKFTYKHFVKRMSPDIIMGKKYVLFGFHKQPEATIDICGRYFENQQQNVLNIWRMLPPDWYLVIKEHSNAVGDRGWNFFREFTRYPNIIIVDEKADSHLLMKNSQLVISNTGTMALEAAMLGIPAITLSRTFFNKLNYCKNMSWVDIEKYTSLKDIIDEIKKDKNNIEEYTEFIEANSFNGLIYDALLRPEVTFDENIVNVYNAMMCTIEGN